jgi:hypothetical protein
MGKEKEREAVKQKVAMVATMKSRLCLSVAPVVATSSLETRRCYRSKKETRRRRCPQVQ